jgi:hypothetical protein
MEGAIPPRPERAGSPCAFKMKLCFAHPSFWALSSVSVFVLVFGSAFILASVSDLTLVSVLAPIFSIVSILFRIRAQLFSQIIHQPRVSLASFRAAGQKASTARWRGISLGGGCNGYWVQVSGLAG